MSSTVLHPAASTLLPYIPDPYHITRRRTRVVMVGNVGVGGDNPIRLQSMTTTRTQDVEATTAQAVRLVQAGCEIVRITAPTTADAIAIGAVRARLRAMDIMVPLVADIHFSPSTALAAVDHVEKVRVNPGNFADSRKFAVRDYTDAEYAAELERIAARFTPLVLACKARGVAMRIGTNHGSLSDRVMNRFGDSPEGMVESALEFVHICEAHGYHDIILSMKASNPKIMIAAYRLLVARMDAEGMAYPLHLGVTEAGNGNDARIKSAVGIGSLLLDGLGDTIRVSLAEEPEEEIPVARALAALCAQPLPDGEQSRAVASRTGVHDRNQAPVPPVPWDPYQYARRACRTVRVGELPVGGEATIAVAAPVAPREPVSLPVLGARGRKVQRPDMLLLDLDGPEDLERLRDLSRKGEGPAPRPLVARSAQAELLYAALPLAESVCLVLDTHQLVESSSASLSSALALAEVSATSGRAIWLEAALTLEQRSRWEEATYELATLAGACDMLGQHALLVSLRVPDLAMTVRLTRLLAAQLAQTGPHIPIVLVAPATEEPMLSGAAALGSLLCDGVGDALLAPTTALAFDLLQGAGARLTRTDYVACPSCGRTLFDLQSTTERIKARTSHLKGVKIAIMGCVVNGPGEMADADFGYMGGSPGHVNLYVGKECVERSIPEAEADERLIALIQAHGRWVEPGQDDE